MKKMNKKSNVPVILFVIGVFVVCSFALLSFFLSEFTNNSSFVFVSAMQNLNIQQDEYGFYLERGVPESKIDTYFEVLQDAQGKYLYIEVIGTEGFLFWKKEILLFSARQYLD